MIDDIVLQAYPDLLFSYQARTLVVTDQRGMMMDGLQGLYARDLRVLSRYRLLVQGKPPGVAGYSAISAHAQSGYFLCPGLPQATGEEADRQIVIRFRRNIAQGMQDDLTFTNYGQSDADLDVAWELAADFADLMEVIQHQRRQSAPVRVEGLFGAKNAFALRFIYQSPDLPSGCMVHLTGPLLRPAWDGNRLQCHLFLKAHATMTLGVRVIPELAPSSLGIIESNAPGHDDPPQQSAWWTCAARIKTNTSQVQQAWDRAVADLGALALGAGRSAPERSVPSAGIPRYQALFGRDALTTGGQALFLSPMLAEGALSLLGSVLGNKVDDYYDEQPGRVGQQFRDNPLALLGLDPYLHYYGDYAAPCAFLVLVGAHHLVVGDRDLTRTFLDPARRILAWLNEHGDLDGDGFLEYETRSSQGQKNQGWKDAGNAIITADGKQVQAPIATCELQGYWYAALLLMAEVFLNFGEMSHAFALYHQAEDLKRRFNERYWLPDEQFYALALDPQKRQIQSIASNAGHCLATGIVDHRHAEPVVRRLMAPDMFSGWGIRTLSARHPSYNPFSYQLGSVWPSENATIALGMKRYGYAAETNQLAQALFDASMLFPRQRLPETFGGCPRDAAHPHPGIYPDACAPQAWSASAIMWLIQAMLGIWSYAPLRALIVDPQLPDWLPELTLENLRINDAHVSIQFTRTSDGTTDYRVLARHGRLHVLRQPPPDAQPGLITRVRDLVESLLPGH